MLAVMLISTCILNECELKTVLPFYDIVVYFKSFQTSVFMMVKSEANVMHNESVSHIHAHLCLLHWNMYFCCFEYENTSNHSDIKWNVQNKGLVFKEIILRHDHA